MQKINTSVKTIYINSHKETLGSGIHNIVYCFECTIPDYFGIEKMKVLLQEKIFSILLHHFQSAGCLDGVALGVLICLFSFFSFEIILYFILNPNQRSKAWEVIISLNLNTVCLLNEPTALPWKQPFTNKHAGSDLATMSRLCKHLIITIKLSINIHYCSLFKR